MVIDNVSGTEKALDGFDIELPYSNFHGQNFYYLFISIKASKVKTLKVLDMELN